MAFSKIDNFIKEVKQTEKIDTSGWKKFKLIDLFDFSRRGKRQKSSDRIHGKIPYYSASNKNNGLTDYINNPTFIEENAIIISTFMDAYWVEGEFTASDEITIFKDNKLNKYNALFIISVVKKKQENYGFTKKAFSNQLKNEEILLPQDTSGRPNWKYMEEYVKNIFLNIKNPDFSKLEELPKKIKSEIKINTSSWKEFLLVELFPNYERGQRLKKLDRVFGELPLITAGQFNNGIAEYVKPTKTNKLFKDSITIDMFGNCFYQEGEFICDDNVVVIKDIKNRFIGLFLASVINKYVNFDFKKQFRLKYLTNVRIKLLVNKKQQPDWKYMEEYIKELEKKIKNDLE